MLSDVQISKMAEAGGLRWWLFRSSLAILAAIDRVPVMISLGRLRRLKSETETSQLAQEAFHSQVARNTAMKDAFWNVVKMMRNGAPKDDIDNALIDIENM